VRISVSRLLWHWLSEVRLQGSAQMIVAVWRKPGLALSYQPDDMTPPSVEEFSAHCDSLGSQAVAAFSKGQRELGNKLTLQRNAYITAYYAGDVLPFAAQCQA
jgi:hypothetical protein